MAAISFKRSSLEDFNKYNSLLVGNAFTPPPPPPDYDLLETEILTSDTASVTFTGLGSYTDYKHLQIRITARTDRDGSTDNGFLEMNSDSTSSYTQHVIQGNGSNRISGAGNNRSAININRYTTTNDVSGAFGATVLDVLDPFSTSKNTTIRFIGGVAGNNNFLTFASGAYLKTDAVNQLKFIPGFGNNWITGSRFSLYGIRAA